MRKPSPWGEGWVRESVQLTFGQEGKSGLRKVMVGGQCLAQFEFAHDDEAGAVRKGKPLHFR